MNDHADDREFWLEFRRGLLLAIGAIDKKLKVGKFEPQEKSIKQPD